jgi:hypothetical protein
MTMQPHFTEADGATDDREQRATDPQRPDLAADPLTAPTQPAEREYPAASEQLATPTQPLDSEAPMEREADAPVAQSAQTVDSTQPRHEERTVASPDASGDSLFGSNDLTGLRSRWDDVQAGFVDDPRMCVQTADGLVSDVVEQLTNGFSQARAKLEDQWSRGEDVSTEDLRMALKRYREFFDRLLAV